MPENVMSESAGAATETIGETSPFAASWATPPAPSESPAAPTIGATPLSPFSTGGGPLRAAEAGGEAGAELREMLGEAYESLYDEAFTEALTDVVNEAGELAAELPMGESESGEAWAERAQNMLYEHVEPVISAAERLADNLAEELDGRDLSRLSESELDRLAESFAPPGVGTAPLFEGLFGFLKKAAGAVVNVAKKVGSAVVNVGIKPILNRLRGLFRPFVHMLMTTAIHRLPRRWRPVATRLARPVMHALGLHEATETGEAYVPGGAYGESPDGAAGESDEGGDEATESGEMDASVPAAELERDLRAHAAGVIVAPDDATRDALVSAYRARAEHTEAGELNELDAARERFVDSLVRLDPEESVQPALEEFIPVVLAAVRPLLGKVLNAIPGGRKTVEGFLVNLLSPLLQRFLRPAEARDLSRVLVDIGLRLLASEAESASGETDMRPVARALAHTVEDTVTHLGELAPEAFADEAVLEAEAMEAFTRAAGTYLPPQVFKPALRRTHRLPGVFLPLAGMRYARYSESPEVVIPWQVAHGIVTYGGQRLSQYLRDRYGVRPGDTVRARVYIYRLGIGARLSDVAMAERRVPGLGNASRTAVARLHPLTRTAALALLGEPELGRDLPERYMTSRGTTMVGERVYALSPFGSAADTGPDPVPRFTPAPIAPRQDDPDRPGRPALNGSYDPGARGSGLRLTVDRRHHEVRLRLFLSEPRAQEIARLLRQGGRDAVTAAVAQVRQAAGDALDTMRTHGALGRVRVQHEGFDEAGDAGEAEDLIRAPHGHRRHQPHRLARHAVGAALRRIADLFRTRAAEFTSATQDAKNGVTLLVVFDRPPFLRTRGKRLDLGDHVEVRVLPGYAEG